MDNPDTEIPSGLLANGLENIRRFGRQLPDTPGVYRMLDERGDVLYVGKAKSLKKRVLSYLNAPRLPIRLQRMLALTASMEFAHTHTEVEALLLESNLIKKLKPRFNILLRDDKSFPYIFISDTHAYPQVKKHRGTRNEKGSYYGPFAGAGDVNRTITILQKAFRLRNCTDSYFAQRTRPCLQYHIKRCTAPCVNLVLKEEYAEQIGHARDFLEGRSRKIQDRFIADIQKASENFDYEEAADLRDRIRALTAIQSKQNINIEGLGEADVVALTQKSGKSCVEVFFFRAGQNYGNKSYFPRHDPEEEVENILGVFLAQFYESKPVPKEIIVSHEPLEKSLLMQALSLRAGGTKVKITKPVGGVRGKILQFALENAGAALSRHIEEKAGEKAVLKQVAAFLGREEIPERIEVYDNSHISGEDMVGAMIVAGPEGFIKNAYRKFNIREANAADDTGMMKEVLHRRFARRLREDERKSEWASPDVIIMDGGQGQFNAAKEILEEFNLQDDIMLIAIAKGSDRNAGREKIFMSGRPFFQLRADDPVLHYLQRLRDEAHRFAIGTHRARRSKKIMASPLDEIAGIGGRRKKALLLHFGSAQAIAGAGVEDLRKVEGISKRTAQKIYEQFH
ncbi:MAG: excinuclease ABC subunit UvrC [Alphaproteobacteria bacterium]